MIDTSGWHRQLSAGMLDVELNAGSAIDMFSLVSVVDGVMKEKNFLEPTARRVRVILQELLTNVGEHVPDQRANVRIMIHETHLRRVAIDVGDNGPGIDVGVLDRYAQLLLAGEREHGLLLVSRLASDLYPRLEDLSWSCAHHVGCNVIEPQPRPSILFKDDRVGLVRVQYTSPKVLWIGRDDSYVQYDNALAIHRLFASASRRWLPVLALYFAPLEHTSHLAVEVSGHDMSTEMNPVFLDRVFMSIEAFFPDRIIEKRVVVLTQAANAADRNLQGMAGDWAKRHGLRQFETEGAAHAYLTGQTAGA